MMSSTSSYESPVITAEPQPVVSSNIFADYKLRIQQQTQEKLTKLPRWDLEEGEEDTETPQHQYSINTPEELAKLPRWDLEEGEEEGEMASKLPRLDVDDDIKVARLHRCSSISTAALDIATSSVNIPSGLQLPPFLVGNDVVPFVETPSVPLSVITEEPQINGKGILHVGVNNKTIDYATMPVFREDLSEISVEQNIKAVGATYFMGGSTGLYGKENQDKYSIIRVIYNGKEYMITTVCDGHGTMGDFFAKTTCMKLPRVINSRFSEILENPLILKSIFVDFNESLRLEYIENARRDGSFISQEFLPKGGTTVTLSIKFDGCEIIANLADSETITRINTDLGSIKIVRDGVDIGPQTTNCIMLTKDQGPHCLEEATRLLKLGCTVQYDRSPYRLPSVDVYKVIDKEKHIYSKVSPTTIQHLPPVNMSMMPGIYISKGVHTLNLCYGFGDVNVEFMKCEPTVTVTTYPPGTQTTTIMGTDGYFNCINITELDKELVYPALEICTRGHAYVGSTFGHAHADNMTIVVLESKY